MKSESTSTRCVRRPSAGLVVSMVAVVLAGTGSAVAASAITSAQIKDGTIQAKDISAKAKKSLKGKAGPAGPAGAGGTKGADGAKGATGATGPAGATGAAGQPARGAPRAQSP